MFSNFWLQLNMAKRRHIQFSALGPETEEQIKLERKTKFALTCSFHKAIRTLAFRGREKNSTIHFISKLLV